MDITMVKYKPRLFLISVFVFTFISCMKDEPLKLPYSGFTPVELNDGWTISSPAKENMDSLMLDEAFRYFYKEDRFLLGRSMTIIRNGKIVAEAYSRDRNDIHQIQNIKSATKSFTGILACIALQNGILDSVNQRFSDIYPEYFENHQDEKEITIDQALTMRTGLVRDNKNDGYNFFMTKNTVEFALSSQRKYSPGTTFYYTDVNPQLVSYAIQRKYGKPLSEFAKEYLFDPLNIDEWFWQAGRDGVSYGASNLNLKPRDMAKFGQLLLQKGKWGNKQIIDSAWINKATSVHVNLQGWAYGYYIWLNPVDKVFWAAGHGGQTIMVAPDLNLVAVVTAWPYVQDNSKWKDNFEVALYKKVLKSCR
jgi:CubicO group peptidase (beta-lactamase class C family)